MRFIVMHGTAPKWERGEKPSPALVAEVGGFIGGLAKEGKFLGGEGLRATSHGVRVSFKGGRRQLARGPFAGLNETPSGFAIVRTKTLDDAVDWAGRYAEAVGDVEVDIRPINEAWDIGLVPRPDGLETTRWMVLHKADAKTEAGFTRGDAVRVRRLMDESSREGVLLVDHDLAPSAKGRRLRKVEDRLEVTDGPFAETKELLAGYVLVEAASLDEATELARRYLQIVETDVVQVREVAAAGGALPRKCPYLHGNLAPVGRAGAAD